MSAYDLILQGGTLYDPCAGTMELCDLAIKDGKIAARGKNLNAADAETVMDVTGLIVSPGLIDMHCHVYPVFPYQMPDSLRTINAEEYMFRAGVTTAVDAGTTGWRNFGDFKENVIDATKVRVLAFIDMAAKGMHYPPSEQAVADINPEITAAVANTWSDVIVGVKSAHYWAKHEDADHPIWASIDGAIKAASMSGKIVMVDSIPIVPERSYPDILARLRPGDVHTHVFAQQFPLMDENGRMQPYMLAERERGVHFDVGHGSGSFWFRQAVGCFNQGLGLLSYPVTSQAECPPGLVARCLSRISWVIQGSGSGASLNGSPYSVGVRYGMCGSHTCTCRNQSLVSRLRSSQSSATGITSWAGSRPRLPML